MTLFDLEELTSYWVEHPPVHILLGAYLGAGRHQRRKVAPSAFAPVHAPPDLQQLLAELGPGFGTGDVHAGLPKATLDFAELRRRAESTG
jgi:hypothetical protein